MDVVAAETPSSIGLRIVFRLGWDAGVGVGKRIFFAWPAADSEDVAPDPGPVSPRLTIDATVGFVLKPASRLPFLVRSHATSVALCRQELKIGCRLEPLTCDIRKFGPSHHSDKSNRLEWPEFTAFPIRSIVATRFGAGHG